MKKTLATLVVTMAALGVVGATGGAASAGERGGNGAPTPIQDHTANSICAFSGLEDQDHNENDQIAIPARTSFRASSRTGAASARRVAPS